MGSEFFNRGRKMTLDLKNFWKTWGVAQWVIVAVVLALVSHKVYQRQNVRLHQASMENVAVLESDIQQFNSMAERLGQMEELPPVRSQWDYVKAIADEFGVDIQRGSVAGGGFYKGPLSSWDGTLSGDTGAVLVAINAFQQTVPTYLHELTLGGGTAQVTFSVLGGQQ